MRFKYIEVPRVQEPLYGQPRKNVIDIEWLCNEIRKSGINVINMDKIREEAQKTHAANVKNGRPEHEFFVEAERLVYERAGYDDTVLVGHAIDFASKYNPKAYIKLTPTPAEIRSEHDKYLIRYPEDVMTYNRFEAIWMNPNRMYKDHALPIKLYTIHQVTSLLWFTRGVVFVEVPIDRYLLDIDGLYKSLSGIQDLKVIDMRDITLPGENYYTNPEAWQFAQNREKVLKQFKNKTVVIGRFGELESLDSGDPEDPNRISPTYRLRVELRPSAIESEYKKYRKRNPGRDAFNQVGFERIWQSPYNLSRKLYKACYLDAIPDTLE